MDFSSHNTDTNLLGDDVNTNIREYKMPKQQWNILQLFPVFYHLK